MGHRGRSRTLAAVLALSCVAAATGTAVLSPIRASAQTAAEVPLPAANSHGITTVSWKQVDTGGPEMQRLFDLTLTSDAVFRPGRSGARPSINPTSIPIRVRVMLPAGYQPQRAAGYPVLYLLHGGSDDWAAYSVNADFKLKETVAASPFDGIVVMPEGGRTGWYSDWWGETDGHFSPKWETFHIKQLIPWIDANLNTIADRSGRALAGISMGGLGTLLYGGAHPELFSAIGDLSGGTDITDPDAQQIVDNSMWSLGASVSWTGVFDGKYRVNNWGTWSSQPQRLYRMTAVFGPPTYKYDAAGKPVLDEDGNPALFWPGKNPVESAAQFRSIDKIAIYSGQYNAAGAGEGENGIWNNRFHNALLAKGVDHRMCSGYGEHQWPYWRRDFVDFLQYVYGDTTPTTCTTNPGWTEKTGPEPDDLSG